MLQPLRPHERRRRCRIVSLHVTGEPRGGFGVFQLGVAEYLAAQRGQARIVFEQFGARVDVIVVVVVLAVVVEPRLDALGEILVVIHARVFALPEAGFHRAVVSLLEAHVERGVHVDHAAQVHVVREFVDQNVLRRVRVAGIGEQVFFATGTERIRLAAAHAPGTGVAIVTGGNTRSSGNRLVGQPFPLRLVRGELVPRENGESRAALDHRLTHVRPLGEHQVHEVGGFLEGVGVHLGRRDDRIAVCGDPLGVERRHTVLVRRIETNGLHRHGAGHGDLGFVLPSDDSEPVADGRRDDSVLPGSYRPVGHALGVLFEPEHVHRLLAAVDDLELRAWRRGDGGLRMENAKQASQARAKISGDRFHGLLLAGHAPSQMDELMSLSQLDELGLHFSSHPRAAFLDEEIDLRADAEVRQVERRFDRETGPRNDRTLVVRLHVVHVRADAMHFAPDGMAGSVPDVGSVAAGLDVAGAPRRPPRSPAACVPPPWPPAPA